MQKQFNLTEENVSNVLREAEDVITKSKEIDSILSEGINNELFDEHQLEKELEELMNSEEVKTKVKSKESVSEQLNTTTIPNVSPKSSKTNKVALAN